ALSIVIGVVVGLSALFGYRYWQSYQIGQQSEAALQYGAANKAVEAGNRADADQIAMALQQNYPKSTYASLATLGIAERAVAANDLDAAEKALAWAQSHVETAELKNLVTLRMARLTLARDKPEDALKQLDSITKGTYSGLVADLRGDALFKLGRAGEARNAYEDALANVDPRAPSHSFIQMKMDRIPAAAAAQPATDPAPAAAPTSTAPTAEKKES
ncbi:MAG: tetratricopeptide repeat protein, partial [Dokdonella sp.]